MAGGRAQPGWHCRFKHGAATLLSARTVRPWSGEHLWWSCTPRELLRARAGEIPPFPVLFNLTLALVMGSPVFASTTLTVTAFCAKAITQKKFTRRTRIIFFIIDSLVQEIRFGLIKCRKIMFIVEIIATASHRQTAVVTTSLWLDIVRGVLKLQI